MPKVDLIIVNHNGWAYSEDCLRFLSEQTFKDFEIIFVDNGSSDNSLEFVRNFSDNNSFVYPIKLIPLSRNEGFAGGNQAGLTQSKAEYIALLNNDTEPDEEWLGNLVRAMDADPDIGICASKLIVYGTSIIDSAGDGYATSLKGYKRGEGEHIEKYDKPEYVFGACAGAGLYRRKMLDEIGFFDEDFFLIHEDTDLNFRAQLAGWKVLYVPTAVVQHKVRSTIGHMSDTAVYYTLRNSEFVRIKNIPFLIFLRCLPGFMLGAVSEFFYFVVKHRRPRLYLRAKIDVVRHLRVLFAKRKKIMAKKKVDDAYLYSIMTPVTNREFFSSKIKKFFFG